MTISIFQLSTRQLRLNLLHVTCGLYWFKSLFKMFCNYISISEITTAAYCRVIEGNYTLLRVNPRFACQLAICVIISRYINESIPNQRYFLLPETVFIMENLRLQGHLRGKSLERLQLLNLVNIIS